jgi:peptidoglycan/LPS O-acetylase OafA/YrhL
MSQRFQYTPSFDGLRGIAVLCVLLTHASPWFKGGWIGVDLFFALSGYLITSLLQNEYYASGHISFAKFYARRALRLFPPLLVCLAMANLLWAYTPEYYVGANRLLATLAGLFYFANLVQWKVLGMLQHLWSLSVEEHFYLVWPMIVSAFLFKITLSHRILFLVLTGCFIATVRIFVFQFDLAYGLFVIDAYTFTVCRMDAILMGSVLAVVLPHSDVKSRPNVNIDCAFGVLLCLLAAIVLFVRESNIYWRNGGFIFTDLLCLSIVAIAAKRPNQPLLSSKILCWVGRRSYGIYLYHLPIFLTLVVLRRRHSPVNYLLVTALMFAVTILVAALSYRFIERPVLRYKRRYQVASEFVLAHPTRSTNSTGSTTDVVST